MFFRRIQETPITLALFTIHLILYGLMSWQNSGGETILLSTLSVDVIEGFGAQRNPLIWEGQIFRLGTAAFLHGGIWHLLFNNLALYNLGIILEKLLGSAGFAVLYFLALIAGNVATLLFVTPMAISVGASGAIMGLAGALCLFLWLDIKGRFLRTTRSNRRFFFFLVALNLVIGELFPVINNQAHLGGFVAGICFAFFFWSRLPFYRNLRTYGNALFLGSGVLLAIGLVQGLKPEGTYAWHMYRGSIAFTQGKASTAQREINKALRQERNPQALKMLGKIYEQTQSWGEAAAIYQELRQHTPKDPLLAISLIEALTHIGKTQQADRIIQEMQKTMQGKSYAETFTAMMFAVRNRTAEALRLYQALLTKYPNKAVFHNAYAWTLLTAKQKRFRQPKLALQHAKLARLHHVGCSAAILDTLAVAYAANHKHKRALDVLRKAYSCPDALDIRIHLARQERKFTKQQKTKTNSTSKPNTIHVRKPQKTKPNTTNINSKTNTPSNLR
ncbi:MAG: rhomboid family intramembrane serine protease [Myxococcota bacterium]